VCTETKEQRDKREKELKGFFRLLFFLVKPRCSGECGVDSAKGGLLFSFFSRLPSLQNFKKLFSSFALFTSEFPIFAARKCGRLVR
jgi:hypothetical protein